MNLFKKKKEPCCGGNCNSETMKAAEAMKHEEGIKILGSGCAKCHALEAVTNSALQELGLHVSVTHITDFALIASYGVMTTPALVVNGVVKSYGKVLTLAEMKKLLSECLL